MTDPAAPLPAVAELLPHQPPMRLLDGVTGWDADAGRVEARVQVVAGASFYRAGLGVPAWVGVEYLGQAAAIAFGLLARADTAGDTPPAPPPPGMLVSCRRYECSTGYFPEGVTLTVAAAPASALAGSLVKFRGEIRWDAGRARGEIAVYMSRLP